MPSKRSVVLFYDGNDYRVGVINHHTLVGDETIVDAAESRLANLDNTAEADINAIIPIPDDCEMVYQPFHISGESWIHQDKWEVL